MNESATLIYDGDCAFCRQSLRWGIDHLPWFSRYVAFQKINPADYGLTEAQVREQIWLVDGEKRLGGHRAAAWILSQQPTYGWRLLGSLITFYSPVSALVYAWVAKNRHRLPGGTKECSIDDRP
ncbi:DCC1-like thiol-disulfide oxidoreductase family protein [Rhodoluna sp.]|uniref:thiol-disulfide oxidoreductase DCC family protein n=1 Tax=Rhodoluna sp. TaxID=1969481 RepID=UPI0025F67686|nr:DCC1-like thiol-disulfide oxidoreductase family protein [Rhodoluna sp.]